MSKTNKKLAAASVLAAGLGAAYFTKKKNQENEKKKQQASNSGYRNTERGRYEKNSKGIYYSSGNYEAFARPEKPEGVDEKNAYLVGSGLLPCTRRPDAGRPHPHS